MKVIAQGAEAVLKKREGNEGPILVKDRVRKGYRVPELDERIRSMRTKSEQRMISRARRAGVKTPIVWSSEENVIEMEFIEGVTVKEIFNDLKGKDQEKVCSEIGKAMAGLHHAGIMHGDLTTSNMILKDRKSEELYVIDFGLSKTTKRVEDFAVDLYLLYEALKAAHFQFLKESWENIIKAYKYNYTIAGMVLDQLKQIEKRRRYRGE